MPLRKTEIASSEHKLETSAITSSSEVKSLLKPTWNMRTIAQKTILIRVIVPVTTDTANFANLG